MKVVIWKPPVRGGGCKNFNLTPSPAVTSYGPKNLDSYSSTKDINGIFDRFQKNTFFVILGRLKVKSEPQKP